MARPSIIRADTLDLQDPVAPSAKDHPNHAHIFDTSPGISGASIAPHQAETLREVAQETAEAETQNPRVSLSNGRVNDTAEVLCQHVDERNVNDTDKKNGELRIDMYHDEQQDDLAIALNGGVSSVDEDDIDGESESDMDDDLMDKISSSPSIEDGALYPTIVPVAWPRRESSLTFLPEKLSAANVSFDSPLQKDANYCGNDRMPHFRETSVSRQEGELDVAEWRRHPGFRPNAQLRHSPSQLGECRQVHEGPSEEQQEQNCLGFGDGDGQLRTNPILVRPEARFSYQAYHQSESRDEDAQVLLHREGSHDIAFHAYETCMDTRSFVKGSGVMDQLSHSNDSFHYEIPPVETCSDDEYLLKPEDIDFEFVYALHTFVATVEGQANATKGDTMVLLDDSNSYWWLVRVVKDSSIGYLPAEHIETPTERLARLNKHRNIDLSATMLGDQAQKQKNSFKTIRRRRKTVTFADPTYVDYSDFDYSTDDEDIDELFGSQPISQQHREQQLQNQQTTPQDVVDDAIADDTAKVEPLKTRNPKEDRKAATQSSTELLAEDKIRSSEESLEDKHDGPSRSRNGTVRNTDSFFKDDSVETKKITLTPNLLRDDNAPRSSSDSTTKDARPVSGSDKIDRELISDKEKKKLKDKDKKDKDKKSGGLRGFFSRKDKKKAAEDDDESFGKRSMDIMSESRDSEDRSIEEQQLSPDRAGSQRQPSKLQKNAPSTNKTSAGAVPKSVELSSYLAEGRNNDVSNVPPTSMRIVDPETKESQQVPSNQPQGSDSPRERCASTSAPKEERSVISKLVPSRSAGTGPDIKPRKTIKAKTRMELDASDSSEPEELIVERAAADTAPSHEPVGHAAKASQSIRSPVDRAQMAATATATAPAQQAQQSPKQDVSARSGFSSPRNASNPPALMVDTSSPEDITPEASPSPELVQTASDVARGGSSASSGKGAAWDDTKLRAFFDESDHIRDLLVVVYDKTNVEPAGNDHPVVGGLFREQNAKLAEITTQLDNMLGDWLARKQRLRGTI
ncbi:hypothetical protein EsDP_00006252 [Epichloe bromicola]|uniref:SH3 domain-containing protein n=2 Tax=Epichloe bromicola TaxID=79588 RepID=A0ABQ0CX49_9HYPO